MSKFDPDNPFTWPAGTRIIWDDYPAVIVSYEEFEKGYGNDSHKSKPYIWFKLKRPIGGWGIYQGDSTIKRFQLAPKELERLSMQEMEYLYRRMVEIYNE